MVHTKRWSTHTHNTIRVTNGQTNKPSDTQETQSRPPTHRQHKRRRARAHTLDTPVWLWFCVVDEIEGRGGRRSDQMRLSWRLAAAAHRPQPTATAACRAFMHTVSIAPPFSTVSCTDAPLSLFTRSQWCSSWSPRATSAPIATIMPPTTPAAMVSAIGSPSSTPPDPMAAANEDMASERWCLAEAMSTC